MDNPSSLSFFLFCFCWVALIAGAVLGYIIGIRMARSKERHRLVKEKIRKNKVAIYHYQKEKYDYIEQINRLEADLHNLAEESELYNYLAPTKFLFVIFQERGDGAYVFDRVMFWNIPNDDLEEVHRVWARTVQTIREGVQLIHTPRGVSNNLPKQAESPVAHVRPHGKDASDKLPLPDGRMVTKQCFWLNNTYIAEQINR